MKNLLLLTDFSKSAKHAAVFAYSMAQQMEAELTLCHAVIIPSNVPQAGLIAWPLPDTSSLLNDGKAELGKLKATLEGSDSHENFKPNISFRCDPGTPIKVVKDIASKKNIDFIFMAAHGVGLSGFILGDHVKAMINETGAPLFIIPPAVKIRPIRNIGFATDFRDPDADMKFIKKLVELATAIQAEVFIVHVCLEGDDGPEFEKSVEKILLDICCDNNYPKIQYKAIKNTKEKQGLEWLINTCEIDLLVVIHHHQDFFERLIRRSLSSKLANNLSIPLLIYKNAIDQQPI